MESIEPTDIIEQSQELRREAQLVLGSMQDERAALEQQMATQTRRAAALDHEISALSAIAGNLADADSRSLGRSGSARHLVHDVLREHSDGLVLSAIVVEVARRRPKLKRSTIQQTVSALVSNGTLLRERLSGNLGRYRLATTP